VRPCEASAHPATGLQRGKRGVMARGGRVSVGACAGVGGDVYAGDYGGESLQGGFCPECLP